MSERVVSEGQWLGSSNWITEVRKVRGMWVAVDVTGCMYTQDDHPDGLKTWDEKTAGNTESPRTPWPPE